MTDTKLKSILELHSKWLSGAANGKQANLRGANLDGASLIGAKGIESLKSNFSILPQGDLIGYKKLYDESICTLKIPADARRSNATGRKCRTEYADVLKGNGCSSYDPTFIYEVGKRVVCNKWDDDWTVECGGGIHFFITEQEAKEYPI